ncbi:hypothetical protein ACFSC4_01225 [Deinococcus malanensis]|uniref:hypothetical protein n=1 Tax=Deinococcus malanensis TaxID=1706855 RepID=UPI003645F3CE
MTEDQNMMTAQTGEAQNLESQTTQTVLDRRAALSTLGKFGLGRLPLVWLAPVPWQHPPRTSTWPC